MRSIAPTVLRSAPDDILAFRDFYGWLVDPPLQPAQNYDHHHAQASQGPDDLHHRPRLHFVSPGIGTKPTSRRWATASSAGSTIATFPRSNSSETPASSASPPTSACVSYHEHPHARCADRERGLREFFLEPDGPAPRSRPRSESNRPPPRSPSAVKDSARLSGQRWLRSREIHRLHRPRARADGLQRSANRGAGCRSNHLGSGAEITRHRGEHGGGANAERSSSRLTRRWTSAWCASTSPISRARSQDERRRSREILRSAQSAAKVGRETTK